MTKAILALITVTIITGAALTGCSEPNPEQKVENAQAKVDEANRNLDSANSQYMADIDNYRRETDAKVAANNKIIADLKARVDMQKAEAKDAYNKKIAELEQKNEELKKRMDDYKAEGKANWDSFKTDFNRSMNELGNAFKDLSK